MSYWINPEVNLGVIKAGRKKEIVFKALETMPVIKLIYPYCGCTATNYNEKTKELTIIYDNAKIPEQVQGVQVIIKKIEIMYQDDTSEVLIIKATKTR